MCDWKRARVDIFEGDVNLRKRNCSGPINDHDE